MKTRLCQDCGREVRPALVEVSDDVESIFQLSQKRALDGSDPSTPGSMSATIRLKCSCSYVDVEVSGSVLPFNVPEVWSVE